MNEERKERRGFASMDREKQREIAIKGGRAAHGPGPRIDGTPKKKAHEWTPEEAREAGRKGGQLSRGGRGRRSDLPESPMHLPEGTAVDELRSEEDIKG